MLQYLSTISEISRHLDALQYSQLILLTDTQVRRLCLPILKREVSLFKKIRIIELPSGESYKNLKSCQHIWKKMMQWNVDRDAIMINLGGGVIGDIGGFAASVYKRGIRFIHIPTTLLAMTDASVGGKTAIDFMSYKNIIGVFAEPDYVFICPAFLHTLSFRQLMSGYAEMVKHALVGSASFWEELQAVNPATVDNWLPLIQRSVSIKERIVSKDYRESGARKVLNFGHTIGHALESHALNNRHKLLHGHAIALGMIAEAYLSVELGYLSSQTHEAICAYLLPHYAPYGRHKTISFNALRPYLYQDKKNKNGSLRFSLLKSPGSPVWDIACSEQDVKNALRYLRELLQTS